MIEMSRVIFFFFGGVTELFEWIFEDTYMRTQNVTWELHGLRTDLRIVGLVIPGNGLHCMMNCQTDTDSSEG